MQGKVLKEQTMNDLRNKLTVFLLDELANSRYDSYSNEFLQENINNIVKSVLVQNCEYNTGFIEGKVLKEQTMNDLRNKLTVFLLDEWANSRYDSYSNEFLQENINNIVKSVLELVKNGFEYSELDPFVTYQRVYECDNCYGEDCRDYCVNESWD